MSKIKIYGAGKTQEAKMWINLTEANPDIIWTASWPKLVIAKIPDHQSHAPSFWTLDEAEIRASDAVLLYSEMPTANFRGALVECGMALALSKAVFIVGERPEYGTWQFHPLVSRYRHLSDAMEDIRLATNILERNRIVSMEYHIKTIREELYLKCGYADSTNS